MEDKNTGKQPQLKVKSGTKDGKLAVNHNLRVRSGIKAGRLAANHNTRAHQ